jgi:hypothetical protein
MPRGRPSKLTKELTDILEEGILVGMPYTLACQRAGISFEQFNNWRKGQIPASVKADVRNDFLDRIKRAEAQAIYEALRTIKNAAEGTIKERAIWTAAAWLCERRYPEYFGRRNVEVTGSGGGPIEHMFKRMIGEMADEEGFDADELEEATLEAIGRIA